jgi:hypothetical protein
MANERIVLLKGKGAAPEIEFLIGNAQWGSYKLEIFSPKTSIWEESGAGVNWDTVEDRFKIGKTAKELDGAFLRWTLAITPLKVGDPYSVSVNIYQAAKIVEGGSILHHGVTLLETHPAAGLVKVVAV